MSKAFLEFKEVYCSDFKQNESMATYVGSFARFKNKQTLSMEPFSSKSCLKNLAVSIFTLTAQKKTF